MLEGTLMRAENRIIIEARARRDSDGDACTPARGAVAAALLLFVGRRYYDEKWMVQKIRTPLSRLSINVRNGGYSPI